MDGLIIKKEWLDLIMSGKKTIEVRGCYTFKMGQTIYLLESKTHRVRGTCTIDLSVPISNYSWRDIVNKTGLDISYNELKEIYKRPHAWVLSDVKEINNLFYRHPQGAVIWVKDVKVLSGNILY